MNKMIKLPLFLFVCCAACAVILAGLYQVTQPIIEKTKAENAAIADLTGFVVAALFVRLFAQF